LTKKISGKVDKIEKRPMGLFSNIMG